MSNVARRQVGGQISPKREMAFAVLLVLGIVTVFCSLTCFGGSAVMSVLMSMGVSFPGVPSSPLSGWGVALSVALAGVPTAAGLAEIVCGVKIRNGSRRAGVVAAIMVGVQMLLLGAMEVEAGWEWLSPRGNTDGALFGVLLWLSFVGILGFVEWLVMRALKEKNGRMEVLAAQAKEG